MTLARKIVWLGDFWDDIWRKLCYCIENIEKTWAQPKGNRRFPKLYLPSVYNFQARWYAEDTKFEKEIKIMANTSMGEIISTLRKEKGMTQKDIADQLGITDKAVSKWERDIAFPDTATIPKLAEILGISVEELMQAKAAPVPANKDAERILNLVLKAVPLAMGVAVTVTSLLGELDMKSGFTMLGIGIAAIGAYLLKEKN